MAICFLYRFFVNWLLYLSCREDDEKRSLTGGSKAESETDSMAEYGDADPGRFTEDGSFIGEYNL